MKIDVENLTNDQLDYMVGKALPNELMYLTLPSNSPWAAIPQYGFKFSPTTNWLQGGPIIEHERIELHRSGGGWYANSWGKGGAEGKTILIAAMRAYVVSKFGYEVEVPA